MRTGAFEFGVGAALLAAVLVFAVATVLALAVGDDYLELSVGSVKLYRFVNRPGLMEIHIGPVVFLLALVAGVGRLLMMRSGR
jgi:hypothetical protein